MVFRDGITAICFAQQNFVPFAVNGNSGPEASKAGCEAPHFPAVLQALEDADGGLDDDSMIDFRLVDCRVCFEVALDTMEETGLKASSRMLDVAMHAKKDPCVKFL